MDTLASVAQLSQGDSNSFEQSKLLDELPPATGQRTGGPNAAAQVRKTIAKLAQKFGQLHPFIAAVFQQGQLASFGPTDRLSRRSGWSTRSTPTRASH